MKVGTIVKHEIRHYGTRSVDATRKPPQIAHGMVVRMYDQAADIRFKQGGRTLVKRCLLRSLQPVN